MGNDRVVIRGLYKGEREQARFPATITVEPAGREKTLVEIKISTGSPGISAENIEKAAREIFHIIEKETGIPSSDK